jgi:hypothetical protein
VAPVLAPGRARATADDCAYGVRVVRRAGLSAACRQRRVPGGSSCRDCSRTRPTCIASAGPARAAFVDVDYARKPTSHRARNRSRDPSLGDAKARSLPLKEACGSGRRPGCDGRGPAPSGTKADCRFHASLSRKGSGGGVSGGRELWACVSIRRVIGTVAGGLVLSRPGIGPLRPGEGPFMARRRLFGDCAAW